MGRGAGRNFYALRRGERRDLCCRPPAPCRTAILAARGGPLTKAGLITPQSPPEDVKALVGETIEPLGTRIVEGVEAEGVRVTSPVPAKAGGGGQPGRVVYERWYSHELRRDVLIKCSDPRFGEAVFRLTDIRRVEPSPALFTVPADYRVEPALFGRQGRGGSTNEVR
jgi:hypothetical protein